MTSDPVEHLLANDGEGLVWELFHENSKTSLIERHPVYGSHPSDAMVVAMMRQLRRVKIYGDAPKLPLPPSEPRSDRSFAEVVRNRSSARGFGAGSLPLEDVAALLEAAAVVTRDNEDNDFPRPFRSAPSGGALYPLEIYLHAARVDGLAPGLYHLDPEQQCLDVLREGDQSAQLRSCMVQPDLYDAAALTLMFSAVFVRSVFKYGDRGYRFVLLEAGHLAQNVLLAAEERGVAAVPIGGFLDRAVDRFLRLDGVNESAVYLLHAGRKATDGHRHPAH